MVADNRRKGVPRTTARGIGKSGDCMTIIIPVGGKFV